MLQQIELTAQYPLLAEVTNAGQNLAFVESPVFTKRLYSYLDNYFAGHSDYLKILAQLAADPERGRLIPGSNGLRELTIKARKPNPPALVSFIYLYSASENRCTLLSLFHHGEALSLSNDEIHALAALIGELKRERT